jgi:uncharacterized DUF497 family protein
MTQEKAELRAAGMHEVGVRMDDLLEEAQREVLRCEGASVGLLQAVKAINELNAHVDADVTEERYGIDVAKVAKQYLSRSAQVVTNLSMNASNKRMMAIGQAQGVQTAVAITKKLVEHERSKAVPPVEEDSRRRTEGVRPAPTIKEQRLREPDLAAHVVSEALRRVPEAHAAVALPDAPTDRGARRMPRRTKANGKNA